MRQPFRPRRRLSAALASACLALCAAATAAPQQQRRQQQTPPAPTARQTTRAQTPPAQRTPSTHAQVEQAPKAVYIPYGEAEPVIGTLAEILPTELRGKRSRELAPLWPAWVARRDAEIRARLAQGDEDSLVNFLLFGTTFTRHPRVNFAQIKQLRAAGDAATNEAARLVETRAADLVTALAAPGTNDRLHFARQIVVAQKNLRVETPAGRAEAVKFLRAGVERVLGENDGYARALEAARLQGNATGEFAERSRLYRARGLSSDTSLMPNFAVEESLREMKTRGLLAPGAVRRVAVIGPGLDITDKEEGYDFYPQQTIQPFAVVDSLARLGLAAPGGVAITTFDLSPRVNSHLERAARAARAGQGYTIQLPRDPAARWRPEAVAYWQRFGDRVGDQVAPIKVAGDAGGLVLRAVRVRPEVAARLTPVDTNIVLQRLELPEAERFDLIVATNIFVYYDIFDQSLAMLNVERMLRPGGLMLSNNALLELPFFRVRSVGYHTTVYSERAADGDHLVWYRLAP